MAKAIVDKQFNNSFEQMIKADLLRFNQHNCIKGQDLSPSMRVLLGTFAYLEKGIRLI
jgi:uncharacterized membrane protein